jgi:predicted amidohydrolase
VILSVFQVSQRRRQDNGGYVSDRWRALEQQCVTVMSSIVGDAAWSRALGTSYGAGGVFCPPDTGFPSTGILAEGPHCVPGWVYAEVDLGVIAKVRADGVVLNRRHWAHQVGRDAQAQEIRLR